MHKIKQALTGKPGAHEKTAKTKALGKKIKSDPVQSRLKRLHREIKKERISYGELAELQGYAKSHPKHFRGNPELAEWAGMKESKFHKL